MNLFKAFVKSARMSGRALDKNEIALCLAEALNAGLDDAALADVAVALSESGVIRDLAPILAELERRAAAAGEPLTEEIQKLVGFQSLYFQGISIPARGPLKINPRPKKVLSFVHAAPPYNTSGYAIRTHAVARAYRATGDWSYCPHTRIGFPWDVRGAGTPPASNRTVYDDIEYIHDRGLSGARGNIAEYIARAAVFTEKAIYAERPSVVHAASAYVNALPALIGARRAGLPFVYEVRGLWELTAAVGRDGWFDTDRFKLEKAIETTIAKEADAVIAITEGVRRELIVRGVDPKKFILSPNGIDLGEFKPAPYDNALAQKWNINPAWPTIGYIGSFVDYEGLEMLLESIAALRAEGPEFNVLMVGDGRGMPSFRRRLAELGLEDFVRLPGRIDFADVPRYYSLIDITPFPRLPLDVCELVSPLKPLEALALGKLVIASSVGGLGEIISDEINGLVFPAGDGGALTRMLGQCIRDLPRTRDLRIKGQRWVTKHRPWSINVQSMDRLFDRIAPRVPAHALPADVRTGQVVSFSVDAPNSTTTISVTYRMADDTQRTVDAAVVLPRNMKRGIVDTLVPPGAVALTAFARNDKGAAPVMQVCDTPAQIMVKPDVLVRRLDAQMVLGHNDNLTLRFPVVGGAHYNLGIDVTQAEQGRNGAFALFTFPGASGEPKGDIYPQKDNPGKYYRYLVTQPQRQSIPFIAPADATSVEVVLRLWTKAQSGPIAIGPYVTLADAHNGMQSADLRETAIHKASEPAKIALADAEIVADFPIQAARAYAMGYTLEWEDIPEGIDLARAALMSFDFGDNRHGAYSRQSNLKYSARTDRYYAYLDPLRREGEVAFTAPDGVTSVRVGLRRWTLPQGQIRALPLLTMFEGRRSITYNEWNPDPAKTRILVFADLNLSLIDGSAIWLMSVTQALTSVPDAQVYLLARNPLVESPFLQVLRGLSHCHIIDPAVHLGMPGGFTSEQAKGVITDLDAAMGGFDYVVTRGLSICRELALEPRFEGRLCPYLTDIPQDEETLLPEIREEIGVVFTRAHRIFLQSKWLIDFIGTQFPAARDKIVMLPPMIPVDVPPSTIMAGALGQERVDTQAMGRNILVYAGKMAPEWGILELFETFDALRAEMPDLKLVVIGSKIHNPPEMPDFAPKIRARLAAGEGIVHIRNMARGDILRLLPECSVGWAWRDPPFEMATLELSTKLLEYASSALPSILVRTPRYEELLGADYPFFAETAQDLVPCLRLALTDEPRRKKAQKALERATRPHRMDLIAEKTLAPVLQPRTRDKGHILVAGHDLKFSGAMEASLILDGWNVYRDIWSGHNIHDENRSRHLMARADVVFCEWALGNLAWYAANLRPGSTLVSRLHAQELNTDYLRTVRWERVSRLFFVNPLYRDRAVAEFSVPADICDVLPNLIDTAWFDRPRDADARFRLGMVGIVPQSKRLDRALDILARLRRHDPRFTLHILGKMPHEYAWMAKREDEMAYFRAQLSRAMLDRDIAGAVHFDGFTHNLPAWYAKIGFTLSVSDFESFHMSVAESAAGGTIPIVLPWPAAASVYPADWIVPDDDAAVARILQMSALDDAAWKQTAHSIKDFIAGSFTHTAVAARLGETLAAYPLRAVPKPAWNPFRRTKKTSKPKKARSGKKT